MKVKMKAQLTGTRNGVAWPAPGEEIDLPDAEGAKLCANGLATPVETRKQAETAKAKPAAETRKK